MKELLEINEVIRIGNDLVTTILVPMFTNKNIKNTGEFLESLEAKTTSSSEIQLWGVDYSEFAVNGRKAGKQPPVKQIEKWVQQRLGYSGDKALTVAFAITNKIKKEGTDRHQAMTDKLVDILESQEVTQYITQEVTKIVNKRITERLINEMKSIQIK
ncbi:hypothetical protein [Empedobacter sp. 189-2]|uniref:hypothetical protein n=1 Tax=Empedobacter sp. 189-2 TaxID=2746724 RepID=UPI002578134E|nr:hypothetical protein [Empedobacter sp. 189-2]MDM1542354.1 hypothetical protein [Empedobacter sp. 189-2]